ncbi:MAG: 50S ribosomal protein L11 methyltransferase [Candidatus Promineifilaceae bacterium]
MPSIDTYWLEISVAVDGEAAEAVSATLEPYAYQGGVVIEQMGDLNDPDPLALEPEIVVKIYAPDYEDTPELRRKIDEALYYLGRLYPVSEPRYRQIVDEDWSTTWRKNYKPFQIGRRIWIQPSWLEAENIDGDDLVITLDPGMAFGTGLHPSTRMCIEAMEELVQPGYSILDIGTGSGILAIAAVGFGARKVLALDKDRIAVRTARENVRINLVSEYIELLQGSLDSLGPSKWDIVVVNILAPVIIGLIQEGLLSYLSTKGRVIMSGIIDEQVESVQNALGDAGGEVTRKITTRDWVALVAKQKAPYPE